MKDWWYFSYFSQKTRFLISNANWLLWRQFAWNIKSCFLGKIRKSIWIYRLLKILLRVLSIKFCKLIFTAHSLGRFSRWQTDYILFLQKIDLDISCKLSPLKTICMKCQNLFSGKIKTIFQNVILPKILPRKLTVKGILWDFQSNILLSY